MCTVTFIPAREQIYLTSNRDEKKWRQDAVTPTVYEHPSGKVLFPKDPDAGGTWIAAHENGNAIVFLNGGLTAHIPQPPYRKSRGLILLDLIEGSTPYNSFRAIKLTEIEPFTAVIWDDQHLFECRWDGNQKHTIQIDHKVPQIWSSVTLYDAPTISKRNRWFDKWLAAHPEPTQDQILHFHQFTGDGDANNDLLMNRDGQVFTVSVTSLQISSQLATMKYLDLKNNREAEGQLTIAKTMVSR
ncbi:MAG: NRDE family protein [Chitinophagaceae bacterium]|nr:NRDE family protein [Chitinophagaceae bacterium]